MKKYPKFVFSLLSFLLFFSIAELRLVHAQASVNVDMYEPVYRDIDKLVAHGLIKKIIVGQRPYSRREIARLAAEARYYYEKSKTSFSEKNQEYLESIFARLQKDYHEELVQLKALEGEENFFSFHGLESIALDYTGAKSPSRAVVSTGPGSIDAALNPFLQNRQGRRLVDGSNLAVETTHWLRASDHFALYAQPRFQLAFLRNSAEDDHGFFLQNLYGKFYVKNLEIQVGRDNLLWGQGAETGLILSSNPRALDMIKISNDEPFFFPWVFRHMGANKFSFFYADMGPEYFFPNAYLVGYKWNLQPLSFFEVGASFAVLGGGEGGPEASLGDRIYDALPFSNSSLEISNKFAGVEMRFRIPPARGMEIYAEFIIDDSQNPFKYPDLYFWEDAGWVGGIYFPRLDSVGKLDLRLEYQHTGKRYYQHGQFQSGWTLNQNILGTNLGPDAHGAYATLRWDASEKDLLSFVTAFEQRSSDQYLFLAEERRFDKIEDRPEERRLRGVLSWNHQMQEFPLRFWTALGYERVQNFNFIANSDRNNFLAQVGFKFYLDKWTRIKN